MVQKILSVLIGMMAFGFSAFAQTESQHLEFEAFDTIVIDDEFAVNLRPSSHYMVDYTVDAALENNRLVEVYNRGKTLYITLNRKGMSSELKKAYRGRGAGKAVLRATVSMPSLSAIQVQGKALLEAGGVNFESDRFSVTVSDNAKVNGLSIKADRIEVDLSKNAEATMALDADNAVIRTSGNSNLTASQLSNKLEISASGSTKTNLSGDAVFTSVYAKGNPDVVLSGKGDILKVDAGGTSELDAVNYAVREATMDVTGSSKSYVSPSEKLSLTMKGGYVVFAGEPLINILSIKSASVTRLADERPRR